MGLFGSLVQLGFGGPPDLLPWEGVNAQNEQLKAIQGNARALPEAQSLAKKINTFSQQEIQRMLEMAMPGYAKMRDRGTQTITDFMGGKVPDDVSRAVQSNAAARSLYGGFAGTGMSRNLTARDLGLTSLDLMTKGLDSASRWIGMSRTLAPTMDVTSMFLSPAQQVAHATSERDKKLNYINTKQQFEYAADPMRQVEKDVGGIADMVGTALMAYMGGGIGAMGGMGAAGGSGGMMGMLGGGGGGGMNIGSIMGMFGGGGGGGSYSASLMPGWKIDSQGFPMPGS